MSEGTSRADFGRSAIIIVDMQNDFIHPEGWFVRQNKWTPQEKEVLLKTVVPNIEKLSQTARSIGRPVIYIQHVLRADYQDALHPWWREGPGHSPKSKALVEGMWGAQIIDQLQPAEEDFIVTKKGYGGFTGTSLNGLLHNLRVNTCIMTGVGAHVCVETTVREGVGLGFEMIVVSDAIGPSNHPNLKTLSIFFADVQATDEVVGLLVRLKVEQKQ
jgi:nicotinamidase-related amidase